MLPACSTPPPTAQPVRPLVSSPCPPVSACRLPELAPKTNKQLAESLLQHRAALERCAAQIDSIRSCQRHD
ncbi:Rz1-like lysis system protein LysC [Aquitalea sp. ASV11]|uniref:Rz1-like lysis system protein LysC n=1 Tax=Aquitalea sp. ASV11 TaxID=2795103 RepID=UPI00351C03D7